MNAEDSDFASLRNDVDSLVGVLCEIVQRQDTPIGLTDELIKHIGAIIFHIAADVKSIAYSLSDKDK